MATALTMKKGAAAVVGVGSALVDVLLRESDAFLEASGASKGGMTLAESGTIDRLLRESAGEPTIVCGGSACNTVVGIGNLGGTTRFVGKRGNDDLGEHFENDLRANNVEPVLLRSDAPTGRVLSIITPDAQRSMFTFLGASSEITPEEIEAIDFADTGLVHIEGYMLFNEVLIEAALRCAHVAGALVSLDLASYTVVDTSRHVLSSIIRDYVDIVIANEDEARSYTGTGDEREALTRMAGDATIAVVKLGKRGSLVAAGGEVHTVAPVGEESPIDTTGAGDLWASGFLYGIVRGLTIDKAGQLGSACGYEACRVVGAQIPSEGWQRIRNCL